MSERSAEKYDEKAGERIIDLKAAQGKHDLLSSLQAEATATNAETRARHAVWQEEDAKTLSNMSPESRAAFTGPAALLEQDLQRSETDARVETDQAQADLDKADKKATSHYEWHKGAAREAALRSAAEAGVQIDAPDAFPATVDEDTDDSQKTDATI